MKNKMNLFRSLLNIALLIMFGVHFIYDDISGLLFIGTLLIANILCVIGDDIREIKEKKPFHVEKLILDNYDKTFTVDGVDNTRR